MSLIAEVARLKELEAKATKPMWYAWTGYHPGVEDDSIFTVPEPPAGEEHPLYNDWHPDPKHPGMNTNGVYETEVLGCSEWMRIKHDDLSFIAEIRNAAPALLEVLGDFQPGDAEQLDSLIRATDPRRDPARDVLRRMRDMARRMEVEP